MPYTLPPTGKLHILSMGAGVNTVAMLLKYPDRYKGPGRYVVFADTQDELPETYEYIDKYLKPYCKAQGITWASITAGSLYNFEFKHKTFPLKFIRECTRKFKIEPINRFIKEKGATRLNPCTMDIGFCIDESHRWNPAYDTKPQYRLRTYPFFQDKVTRIQCENIIKAANWPAPPKSGCYYCPFRSKFQIKKLAYNHPDLFDKAVKLEQNDRKYPEHLPFGKPLPMLIQSNNLDDYLNMDSCDEGTCMV